ncbi:DUF3800 domain-containing protein [Mucilaginibacter sp. SMC90]|uniref:DUF3800 domain-containing protein n=1 Tax=Mucilaginibacter sp. SMC90 TaxID=2929803 RepID=UPI001FB47112|nr:DUF3800 domain-containing protein [Mucilaginibacter sp. SMC90]UOE47859.1 DUF3800 domain-containing protein [Mucilaginibacter sp. SMC90]
MSIPENPINSSNKDSIEFTEEQIEKIKLIEAEKTELLNKVVSGNIENIKDRVALILNNSNDARNSDIELAWSYWQTFEDNILQGSTISKEQMYSLTRISSLTRIRAKIQNEYKLFQADDEIKRHRGVLEEDKKQDAISDKPAGMGMYSVYIDETGKTQAYLSVGSLWVLSYNYSTILSHKELTNWKKFKEITYEFHFAELSKNKLDDYKEFFTLFLSKHPDVGFKLIVINNMGIKGKGTAITDLTYHLLTKGVEHENSTGRAPLPRYLQVWIDEEEKGSDQLKLENIKERLTSQKIQGLYLGQFSAVASEGNFFIQAIDIFTGAINRKLHNPNGGNYKDEFADFVLSCLKFNISNIDTENNTIDRSKVFNLSDF